MEQVTDFIFRRRSVREFLAAEVSDEKIDLLLRSAMAAPSAMNKKPWEFYVIKDESVRKKLNTASRFTNYDSPLIIVAAGNLERAISAKAYTDFWVQDVSAATENLLIAAANIGLGTCWCGLYPNPTAVEGVRNILNLSEKIVPLALIHVGYPKTIIEPRTQYDSERVHIV